LNTYAEALKEAMEMLACDERTIFLGQAVAWPGTAMSETLADVPGHKKIEMPVAEEMQMGMSIGLALDGMIPVSIFPRWNFLLLATNQLVNHLDKMWKHVIVRVGVGSEAPLYPGVQHVGDYTIGFRSLLPATLIWQLNRADGIVPAYKKALIYPGPIILVENMDNYNA
jgi:pyruvate/2-oxoglutarate/acetoin dehydrogenase E1 component